MNIFLHPQTAVATQKYAINTTLSAIQLHNFERLLGASSQVEEIYTQFVWLIRKKERKTDRQADADRCRQTRRRQTQTDRKMLSSCPSLL